MIPGANLKILARSPFDNNLTIKLGEREFVTGPAITNNIFVEQN
jgi:hypothetical protein